MPSNNDRILVVGAGIGGIRSALDLAETGRQVILIDRAAYIGGVLAQLDNQFPSDHCGMCRLLPSIARDSGSQFCLRKGFFHENIEILTATELSDISGEPGRFTVRLRRTTPWVDPARCMGCGVCVGVCPVQVPDTFNGGLGMRKAIHLPVPHAVPGAYVIDRSACTRCGACELICPTQAICLAEDRRNTFRILVVDDEWAVRDSLREWMINEGFSSVDMAASGPEALNMLKQQSYQLMLTDIKMPGMDGVELLKLAKAERPDLTVIMMTAYATVETAVQAMKIGAMDYFMKPFDPDVMVPLVVQTYEQREASQDMERTVQAVILATGTGYYDPTGGINPYGYGRSPHIVTNLQFERILSAGGPAANRLLRPADARPITRIAWMQCVGSRDVQLPADFCSTICCMVSIKQALLAKEKGVRPKDASRPKDLRSIDTSIYFMDMRTAGKGFQRYRDKAAVEAGVRFERVRVHSISPHPQTGDPVIRAVGLDGTMQEEVVDLVVLALGQRATIGTAALAEKTAVSLNPWGFFESQPFVPARSTRSGIFLGGCASGLRGIGEAVMAGSAAALEAGRSMPAGGDAMSAETLEPPAEPLSDILPAMLVVVCSCHGRLESIVSRERISAHLMADPAVIKVVFTESLCDPAGWLQAQTLVAETHANRVLIGGCHPLHFAAQRNHLARQSGLSTRLMAAVDLHLWGPAAPADSLGAISGGRVKPEAILAALGMGLAPLQHADPDMVPGMPVSRRALVVGGGIAGMQAALGIADSGIEVDLVEQSHRLGGNLHWLSRTLEGHDVAPLLADTRTAVEQHPRIQCRLNSRILHTSGQVGRFFTAVATGDETADAAPAIETVCHISHGVMVLATGGHEAATHQYGYGSHAAILTQKELEERLASKKLDPQALDTVIMILCVGSREAPRNYCSRVCCPTALKHALALIKEKPELAVYILYRDMMTTGFAESFYTMARQAGVIFIQYEPDDKPRVKPEKNKLTVRVRDPILDRSLEIETDLLVLAVGVSPTPLGEPLQALGVVPDEDGYFQEADPKWRPVESIRAGVLACGLALAPGTIADAVISGQAAAQRALPILTRTRLPTATISASVRTSLCTLCRRCIENCPYSARWIDEVEQRVMVNPGMCQGCGACAAVCPNGAAVLNGCSKSQVLEVIDAAFVD